jgi:hypothetical protein
MATSMGRASGKRNLNKMVISVISMRASMLSIGRTEKVYLSGRVETYTKASTLKMVGMATGR